MNSKNGITMISLIVYITSFLLVTGIIAGVTYFFYSNTNLINEELYSVADYNKLNLYFVKESEQKGNRINEIILDNNGFEDNYYVSFLNGDRFTFDYTNHLLYYNSICLCEDVQKFQVQKEYDMGKEVLSVLVGFTNRSFSCKYTMKQ